MVSIIPPLALCEKSVKNEVSPVSTLDPDVFPKTVLALKPPEVMIPCSKSAKLRLRLLRRNIQPPSNAINPAAETTSGKSAPFKKLTSATGSATTTGGGLGDAGGIAAAIGGAGFSTFVGVASAG